MSDDGTVDRSKDDDDMCKLWGLNRWVCAREHPNWYEYIWSWDKTNVHTSQHFLDPYSVDHCTAGVYQYLLVTFAMANCPELECKYAWEFYGLNVGLHAFWEFIENTPPFIYFLRSSSIDAGYIGDSRLNSFGDLICMSTGYICSVFLPSWWGPLILLACLQIVATILGVGAWLQIKGFYGYGKSICCRKDNLPDDDMKMHEVMEDEDPKETGRQVEV